MTIEIEQLGDYRLDLGEGAHWDSLRDELIVVDIPDGTVHVWSDRPDEERTIRTSEAVGKAVPDGDGGFVLATATGFAAIDRSGNSSWTLALLADPLLRMNDGALDPRGRFIAGSMSVNEESGAGALHVLDLDGTTRTLRSGLTIPNGTAWNDAGDRCFFIDSGDRTLYEFAYDAERAELELIRPLIVWDEGDGVPDGMSVDSEGTFWIAIWEGARVENRDPDGRLITSIPVPMRRPTSVAFGGVGGGDLYVTSARGASQPLSSDGSVQLIRGSGSSKADRHESFAGLLPPLSLGVK